jgi:orotidine-5'-phosphate decarboxylase
MLVPGIGSQQGDLLKVITHGGDNIMLNVSRSILYADDMAKTAEKYKNLFNDARKKA